MSMHTTTLMPEPYWDIEVMSGRLSQIFWALESRRKVAKRANLGEKLPGIAVYSRYAYKSSSLLLGPISQ